MTVLLFVEDSGSYRHIASARFAANARIKKRSILKLGSEMFVVKELRGAELLSRNRELKVVVGPIEAPPAPIEATEFELRKL